jgi:hypothetical protein
MTFFGEAIIYSLSFLYVIGSWIALYETCNEESLPIMNSKDKEL